MLAYVGVGFVSAGGSSGSRSLAGGEDVPGGVEAAQAEGQRAGAGFAPGVAHGAIDGPPAPVPPEVVTRDADGRATLLVHRLGAELDLDGSLREAFYDEIRSASEFVQQFPIEGAPATERTDVWVFYDDENVYVAARCWDSAPEDQWIADEMQRDSFQLIQNDRIVVAFDTFYDRRNGLAFMVNPIGGFFDFEISDEGNPNTDWNAVWDVRTGRFEGGWSVEMQIPFKSLRFQQGRSQLWGIQFERQVRRKNAVSHLTPVPIAVGPGIFRLSAAATLAGLEVASENRRLEVKPYAIGSSATDLTASPPFSNRGAGDAGVDAKRGVTQNLAADFTYNTDFAQVEVDEQQVNLTRFSLFFPEKREFFLEARGIFDFGAGPNVLGTGFGANKGGRLQGPPGTRAGNEDCGRRSADGQGRPLQRWRVEHADRRCARRERTGHELHGGAREAGHPAPQPHQPGGGLPAVPGLHALVPGSPLPPAARDRRHTPVHVRRHPRLHRERQARRGSWLTWWQSRHGAGRNRRRRAASRRRR